jgi:tetratricopeptide (TPR) repeat protein
MNRKITSLALSAILAVALAPALHAGAEGRVTGVVTDTDGKPLADVRILVTTPEIGNFRLERKTDGKGKFAVLILDATRQYVFRWEKDGYQPFEESIKPRLGEPTRRDIVLTSGNAPAAPPAPPPAETGRQVAVPREPTAEDLAIDAFNAGVAAHQAGDRVLARQKFEEAASLNPQLAQAHYAMAAVAMEEGRHADAAAASEKSIELDPTHVRALDLRWRAYTALGDKPKAQAAAEALAAADPTEGAVALYNRAVELFNGGDAAGAMALLERIIANLPDHAKAHYMLGLSLVNQGKTAEAKEHLQRFLELAPDDPDAAAAREMLAYL